MLTEGKHTHQVQENPHSRFFEDLLSQIIAASYGDIYENLRNTNSGLKSKLIQTAWSIENVFELRSLIVLYERYLDSTGIVGTPLENTLRHIITILSARYKKLIPKSSLQREIGISQDVTTRKVFDLMDEDCETFKGDFFIKPQLKAKVEQFRKKAFEHLPVHYNYEYIQLSEYVEYYCRTGVSIMDFDEKWVEDTLNFCNLIECQLLEIHMKEVLRNFSEYLPGEYRTRLEKLHDIFTWRKIDMKAKQ